MTYSLRRIRFVTFGKSHKKSPSQLGDFQAYNKTIENVVIQTEDEPAILQRNLESCMQFDLWESVHTETVHPDNFVLLIVWDNQVVSVHRVNYLAGV